MSVCPQNGCARAGRSPGNTCGGGRGLPPTRGGSQGREAALGPGSPPESPARDRAGPREGSVSGKVPLFCDSPVTRLRGPSPPHTPPAPAVTSNPSRLREGGKKPSKQTGKKRGASRGESGPIKPSSRGEMGRGESRTNSSQNVPGCAEMRGPRRSPGPGGRGTDWGRAGLGASPRRHPGSSDPPPK